MLVTRTSPFAVLGMLSLGALSGYEIRRELAESIGTFWSESYGQIYPALRELSKKGSRRRDAKRSAAGSRNRPARRRRVTNYF